MILIVQCILFWSCSSSKKLDSSNFTYLVRPSIYQYDASDRDKFDNWRIIGKDSVVQTKYLRGAACDLPSRDKMFIEIVNDTIILNFGKKYDPNGKRLVGIAGMQIDFVLNPKVYPDYKNFKFNFLGPTK